jgi:Na+/proline symporter/signal transduction histidine kinase
MSTGTPILGLSLAYLGLLFLVAHLGERHARAWAGGRPGPIVYALSLAIYCTSWTFYGAVGRAVNSGLDFALIYVGPFLVIVLAQPFLAKVVRVAKRQNIISIADFLGARYGRSRAVAVVATVIALVGAMPYIALQLQAVSFTFAALSADPAAAARTATPVWHDTALVISLLMAAFTILFGVRHMQASEQHRGMMMAIAFESLVKLCALLAVGIFVVWGLYEGPGDLFAKVRAAGLSVETTNSASTASWVAITALSAIAFICLPRQFHVAVVEHDHPRSLATARILFPVYLVLINLFIIPIALAGMHRLGLGVDPDLFVLELPMAAHADWLVALVFIGGLSAATSMVAIACMALSGMVATELVMPLLLRGRRQARSNIGQLTLLVRRIAVLVILLFAFSYYRLTTGVLPLATIGMVSFCAASNFAPALILGLYWRRAHRLGAVTGLASGLTVWAWTVLWPTIDPAALTELPPLGPLAWLDPISRGFVVGLAVNIACIVVGSYLAKPSQRDLTQADAFVSGAAMRRKPKQAEPVLSELDHLRELTARFIGPDRARQAFAGQELSGAAAQEFTERLLSGTIGAASARVVVTAARRRGLWLPSSFREMLDEATTAIRYNADLLRRTLNHVGLGIAVFDADRRLEVWNERFGRLAGLGAERLHTGASLSDLAQSLPALNALLRGDAPGFREIHLPNGAVTELRLDPLSDRGIIVTANDVTDRVRAAEALRDGERRIRIITDNVPVLIAYVDREERYRFANRPYQTALNLAPGDSEGHKVADVLGVQRYRHLKPHMDAALAGEPQNFEIEFPVNEAKIEIARGTYIPHRDERGEVLGFFLLYVDTSDRRRAEMAMRLANESLERRVTERTAELEAARAKAEDANIDKTRFIAAASHDLLQPLHATRLFLAALEQRHPDDELVAKIELGLGAVDDLLNTLLDIAKLDTGTIRPDRKPLAVDPLLRSLAEAFAPIAAQRRVELRLVASHAVVETDPTLLRRALQNFLSNAIRYGQVPGRSARVLIGCRRIGRALRIEVHDNGPGIPKASQSEIFKEFTRLGRRDENKERGLGLGLAIVDRIARMLDHPLRLVSEPGKGSVFSIEVPLAAATQAPASDRLPYHGTQALAASRAPMIVCIEDEPPVREAMAVLLTSWGCDVMAVEDADQALSGVDGRIPDLVLIDLHLGDDRPDGFAEIGRLRTVWGPRLPAALVTADRDAANLSRARSLGLDVLLKPVKPAQLRALVSRHSSPRAS